MTAIDERVDLAAIESLDFEVGCAVISCEGRAAWMMIRLHKDGSDCEAGPICTPCKNRITGTESLFIRLSTAARWGASTCALHNMVTTIPSRVEPL